MASLDALRNVSLGRFYTASSPVHGLDARAKLICAALLTVAISLASTLVANGILLLALLVATRLARIPLGASLSSIRPALPIIGVLALFQLLFYQGRGDPGVTLLDATWFVMTTASVRMVLVSLLRFLLLMLLIAVLTGATTPGDMTRGVEGLLGPLSRVGLPGHELALVVSIALRFLPILGKQMETISYAQASRGLAGGSSRWQVGATVRRTARMLVPLFVEAYRRSEEMTMAMQARCYQGGRNRTHLRRSRFSWQDGVALAATVTICVLAILARQIQLLG